MTDKIFFLKRFKKKIKKVLNIWKKINIKLNEENYYKLWEVINIVRINIAHFYRALK